MQNIARSIVSYYESEEFKGHYAFCLVEDTHHVYQNVKRLLTDNKWELEEKLGVSLPHCTKEQVQKVTDYILGNSEDFTTNYSGHWVGHFCLNSVEFGEQEEGLDGLTNHKTKKPYTKAYLRRIFGKEGFVVSKCGSYAYYIISGGLMLDFSLIDKDTLLELIA